MDPQSRHQASTTVRRSPSGRLSPSDAVLWQIERNPLLRSTITAIALLDQAPDRERLVAKVERATWLIPRLRARVEDPAWCQGVPRWVEVDEVDLDYHLRRVRVPEPAGLREVLDLAQPIAMAAFDPARPLWEMTVVEGMDGGRAAVIQKFHHCLTDGVGGIELALSLLDPVRHPPPRPDDQELSPLPGVGASGARGAAASGGRPSASHLLGSAAAATATSAYRTVAGLASATAMVPRAGVSAVADPLGSAARGVELARVAVRTLAPVRAAVDLGRSRGLARRLHALEIDLEELRAAGHVAGGTVNDALLAAVVEGLRRYQLRHGARVTDLAITMPVSFRQADDDPGGNQFTPARFTVPANVADPVLRMRILGELAGRWRAAPVRTVSSSIAFVLDKLPRPVTTAVLSSMLTGIATVVTNVPGWHDPMYLAGAEVVREFGFAPTGGAALNVALVSHGDTACIGVEIDLAALPDDDVVMDALVEGFHDVLAVVGSDRVRRT